MFQSYFLTAFRNLIKHPLNNAINIFGLSLGLACCVTLLIFITYQLSFDKQFQDIDRVYILQTTIEFGNGNERTSSTIDKEKYEQIKNALPGLELITSLSRGNITIQRELEFEETLHYTDNTFFNIFNLRFLEGSPVGALDKPNSVILTRSKAQKYFGKQPALGKQLPVSDGLLTVTGVIEDIPENSHLKSNDIGILAALSGKPEPRNANQFWNRSSLTTYVKMRQEISLDDMNRRLANATPEQVREEADRNAEQSPRRRDFANMKQTLSAIKVRNSHLQNVNISERSIRRGQTGSGDLFQNWYFIYIAGGLALAVLVISCVNFINLTTARFTQRNREIGLRKVLGAGRNNIFVQFICETFVLTFLAVIVAFFLSLASLPWFEALVQIDLSNTSYASLEFFAGLVGLIAFTTILAGFYPSMVLSRVKPAAALSSGGSSNNKNRLRKILTIVQFGFSILLATTCITLYYQVNHLKNLDLGFELDNISIVPAQSWGRGRNQEESNNKRDILTKELLANQAIHSVSTPALSFGAQTEYQFEDRDPVALNMVVADYQFFDHYQVDMLSGKSFSSRDKSYAVTVPPWGGAPQTSGGVILTLSGMDKLGLGNSKELIGKKLVMQNDQGEPSGIELEILGVANAFPKVLEDSQIPLTADYIVLSESPLGMMSVRIRDGQWATGKEHIQSVIEKVLPNQANRIMYPKQLLDGLFTTMERALYSVGLFAVIAIVIAILGLYAMSSFVVERRTREIGIRKVLGSSIPKVTLLLLWDFSKPVLIALAFAAPVAYLGANQIIQHIAARIPLEFITFGVVPFMMMAISLLTVSSHTLKAALIDPVVALRYE
ncbi:ABC transporter permease [Porticoccaceae bacterium LTM1]|nr:ABC transporter permease [Porticoccaceae bacterium LTM1]